MKNDFFKKYHKYKNKIYYKINDLVIIEPRNSFYDTTKITKEPYVIKFNLLIKNFDNNGQIEEIKSLSLYESFMVEDYLKEEIPKIVDELIKNENNWVYPIKYY
ncbi:TPA: hypothetical protein LA747_003458 [Clostridium botulinum]|nr:hypothetical protein [Clostridium botulinum]HBJ2607795.1 hypothetical protein [Clostridium botulinum]HDI3019148.1 hypothetical protein [Clostridium botulinum]